MTRVLIVEDERATALNLQEALELMGYIVLEVADSGMQAVQLAEEMHPDVILMDIYLSDRVDGIAAAQQIQARQSIPIIYLTAFFDDQILERALRTDPFGYLIKPFNYIELRTTIETALHRHRLEQRQLATIQRRPELGQVQTRQRQEVEQVQLLSTIVQRLHQSLELSYILSTAVAQVRQYLETDRVLVYRFDPDWTGVIIAESVGSGWTAMLGRRLFDPCINADQCIIPYRQGYIGNTPDIHRANLADCYVQLLDQFQVKANLVIPILQGDRLWGLLAAQHCAAPRTWKTVEINFLQQLAHQLATAIQQGERYQDVQLLNARLEAEVASRTAQLQQSLAFEALLNRLTEKIRDSLDEAEILQSATREVCCQLDAIFCNITFYDSLTTQSRVVSEYAGRSPALSGLIIPTHVMPVLRQQMLRGEYCHCSAPVNHQVGEWLTVLLCPLMDRDRQFLGDLLLVRQRGAAFADAEIRLVRQVTSQCAIAIRQSRLYQSSQAQVRELVRLNHLKDQFLSTVSHELRTPISNIRMATQMLEISLSQMNHADQGFDSLQRYFQILKDEGQREINLIDDLLSLTRLEAGIETVSISDVNPQSWILHVVEALADRAYSRQIQLEIDVPANLPTLQTDLIHLERILTELVNNACKYTPAGEIIRISAHTANQRLYVHVVNSGIEIAPEEHQRIFEKFYRIPSGDPWQHGGTGLGLALVQRLVSLLGGTISVSSQDNQTCFTLSLPLLFEPEPGH
ncbi:MAG: GAF domain-containing protein [Elainellaceae cyanobacterium]